MGARDGVDGLPDELEFGPGGLAVLWAEENTRESLFAAMQRTGKPLSELARVMERLPEEK